MNKKATKTKTKKAEAIKNSVQETIPYVAAYANGIIETIPGRFSKTYALQDINFRTAGEDEQETIFLRYCALLNTISDADVQITCLNHMVDKDKFKSEHFLKYKDDGLNEYRQEINDILENHIQGSTSIVNEKFITLTVEADNIDLAAQRFVTLDSSVFSSSRSIGGSEAKPLGIEERLRVLRDALNPGNCEPFSCDMKLLKSQGLSTKDVIAPASMRILKNYAEVGDKFSCSMYIQNMPATFTTEFYAELNELPCSLLSSVHMECANQDKALKLVKAQIVNINSNVVDKQKKAAQNGYSATTISPDLEAAKEEAQALLDALTKRNQRIFYTTFVVSVYADSEEELDRNIHMVEAVGQRHMCTIKKLGYQQEQGLGTALPLGNNCLEIKRLLTTESAGLFLPYSSAELAQENGLYYGLDAVSKNMILFNRLKSKNANGVILGTPGSGKSFSAKREMMSVLLGTDADIYIVDPEREYTPLAEMLGGEVIRIAAGSNTFVNPLDMDMRYADDDDPVTLKSDFISSLCESAIGGKYGLSLIQKSIIDRCVRKIYQPYIEYMSKHPDITSAPEVAPTLVDFYEALLRERDPEAQTTALAMEMFCIGSFNLFAHRTNVDVNNRFVIYDIKDVGTNLKELGLQVCLNDIWNRTIANKVKKKRTWFYLDEFYLLTQNESSAQFLQQVYKRARKWGGVPTGITQNVEDLLKSQEARSILNNCDFVMMLNQAPLDREQLSDMFHISPSLQQYITNSEPGHGLLYTGAAIIPFEDEYPKDTKSFKVMTTNPNDLK